MSDGGDCDPGNADRMFSMLSSMHAQWQSRGFKLHVVGFGESGTDVDYLRRMARCAGSDGSFSMCSTAEQLNTAFEKIADDGKTQQKMFTMVSDTIGREVSDQIELDFL